MGVRVRCLHIGVSLGLILFVFLSGCGLRSPGSLLIGVILWDKEIRSFVENLHGVLDGLREEGYQDGLNLDLRVVIAASDRSRAASAAQNLHEQGARLLITLGTVPTLVALEVTRDSQIPILYSHVGNPRATGLAWPEEPEKARFTGTSNEVGAEEQLDFLLLARPGLRRLGILYCTATPVVETTGAALEAAAQTRGLQTFSAAIPDDRPELLRNAFWQLVNHNIEVLFLPDDPVLVKPINLQWICEQAAKAFLAVVGPSRFCVRYGVFMAYHGDPFEIGRQTGRQAARILSGTPLCEVPPERPLVKRLTVNLKVAQELDLTLPRHFLSRAYYLHQ